VEGLAAELLREAEGLEKAAGGGGRAEVRVPGEIRRAKIQQVKELLSREEAMVAAVSGRLERLQLGL
ncbi:hypothetical protein IMZ48_40545, partial [Candidatus Bathyarchaeota archaeon]|nr:hypothetical protein [Candidatus Bathyarchaeota archaeon]